MTFWSWLLTGSKSLSTEKSYYTAAQGEIYLYIGSCLHGVLFPAISEICLIPHHHLSRSFATPPYCRAQVFHERLLRLLFLPRVPPQPKNASLATSTARACRQFADSLGCPHVDERARLRILRLLLAAARNGYYASALDNGPLWTALLRLASGRIVTAAAAAGGGGGTGGVGGGAASGGVGATQALAKDVVASVRGGWGHSVRAGRDGRAGRGRLFGGRIGIRGIRNDGIR